MSEVNVLKQMIMCLGIHVRDELMDMGGDTHMSAYAQVHTTYTHTLMHAHAYGRECVCVCVSCRASKSMFGGCISVTALSDSCVGSPGMKLLRRTFSVRLLVGTVLLQRRRKAFTCSLKPY